MNLLMTLGLIVLAAGPQIPSIDNYVAKHPIQIQERAGARPNGMTPGQIKQIYKLPQTGGSGTIAIIDAFADPTAEADLAIFDKQFNLADCTGKNGCLEKVNLGTGKVDAGWSEETALDIEWAHAISPKAKILLVEAKSDGGSDLLKAVDYAEGRKPVVISLSWGSGEFPNCAKLDSHFKSGTAVFAAAGDSGAEVEWPAVSVKVTAVGGTRLMLNPDGSLKSENAWSGSGGGVSKYVTEPSWQKSYGIDNSNNYRTVPDVSYNADPLSGFSVYTSANGDAWIKVGGTSAGAPQWAAIFDLGKSATNTKLYKDAIKTNFTDYFRDVVRGNNGGCKGCKAGLKYDLVSGIGTPQTVKF